MELLLERVAGLDVHRDTVVACARYPRPSARGRTSEIREFMTTQSELVLLRTWLSELAVTDVAMEATQLNSRAGRARPTVERLLESEHVRESVGQVAVPFGICLEPTNVKARGQACPFRHQCFGCTHYRTDPSFLPELRAYLGRLLGDDERLRAAAPELEEWARNAAIPSQDEVAAVRNLIGRCEKLLSELAEDERAGIQDAVAVLRRYRAQPDTTVPVRFLGVISPSKAKLFPNIVRDHHEHSHEG